MASQASILDALKTVNPFNLGVLVASTDVELEEAAYQLMTDYHYDWDAKLWRPKTT